MMIIIKLLRTKIIITMGAMNAAIAPSSDAIQQLHD